MRVLFISAEIYPLAKTGGLADVSAALPRALAGLGIDVRLIMPAYPRALAAAANKSIQIDLGALADSGDTRLIAANMPDSGLPVWLVDCPGLFQRAGGPYQDENGVDWPDNARRFAQFNHVAARLALGEVLAGWRPDVVHANDWHAGLVPALIAATPEAKPATVFTIHNVAYQGHFPASAFALLGLPDETFSADGVEFYGGVSFLKAGIRYADHITTVSPSYAGEILTSEFGCGLDGLLRQRAGDLSGILNGVDYGTWDPRSDLYLPAGFSASNISGKRVCKAQLQAELGLEQAPEAPLVAFVSRLTGQKMADVVLETLPAIIARDVQFALLGEGEREFESRLRDMARRAPHRLAVRIGYEEPLAHRIQAGADILLHPSRFEPCGLVQLYAMRYGTVPVVRQIGGLADTVVDASDVAIRLRTATGFAFRQPTGDAMLACLDRALALYRQPLAWRKVQRQAMRQDFGWQASAERYAALYRYLAPFAAPLEHATIAAADLATG